MRYAVVFLAGAAFALDCDMSQYRAQPGLQARMAGGKVHLTWNGERGQQLRAVLAVEGGQPSIAELAAIRAGRTVMLGQNLTPEFHVTSGLRRISNQQLNPLRDLKVDITPAVIDKEKWNVFWDAPLNVPGSERVNPGLLRRPDEVRRASASYNVSSCQVKTDGARIEVSYGGLSMGIFSGRLQFTVYRGTNLLRQEAIAKTDEPSVAYKYAAGMKGLQTATAKRVIWRDVARGWQKYEFGGSVNQDPVALRARNRVAVVESNGGAIAVFPPSHKFFFAREIEMNLGYVWYRKDDAQSFAVGVRHADREEMYRPHGVSDELWQKRVNHARGFAQGNFALYNAPPGTWQRMPVYYYLSAEDGRATQQAVLAFTHDDYYKPLPGYQVAVSHFHTHFNELLQDAGTIDLQPSWLPTFRAMGINIAMMSDFHGDGHPKDPGELRLRDQHVYFEGCRRHSDNEFLIMPGEEPDANFGGHYTTVFPRPVYWTHVRKDGQPFEEIHPKYGKVYHVGSPAEELNMLEKESGLMWQAHPRTKGSTYYPDSVRNQPHFLSDRFLGGSFQSLPVDLSEKRICEVRCFSTLDDMNNWTGPKYMFAEGDTYAKFPEDDTYSHLIVNYVKVPKLPKFDEDWSPITKAIRNGDFFVTSGEVLLKSVAYEGRAAAIVEAEWTFPSEFVEVVWGDGTSIDRKIVPATDQAPFGSNRFRIPVDLNGKKWVRVAVWDSAGNGAFSQPVHLK